ncbi:MAG: response regulator [Alphaproteobacteria bacterium]
MPASDRPGARPEGPPAAELVLIAEDSPTQSEHLAWLLQQAGYRVVAAADGKRALALARELRPDIVVSDVVMPGMDGYELCRAIKSDAAIRLTPVVLVTEWSRPQDVFRGLNCGADNFVTKPYDERYLIARLRYLSANKSLRSTGRLQVGVEIELQGERHFITAERQQILDLLISTYDEAVHLNDELRDRQRELETFLESLNGLANVTEALNRSATVEQVVREALGRTMALLAADAGWIRLRDPDRPGAIPWLAARDGIDESDIPPADHRLTDDGESGAGPVVHRVHWQQAARRIDGASAPAPRLLVRVPIMIEERALGELDLLAPAASEIEPRQQVMLTAIGQQVGIALDRARLHTNLEQTVALRTAELRQEVLQRRRAQERAHARSVQLAEVVRLGNLALADTGLSRLFDEVVSSIAETLKVPFSKLFRFRPATRELVRVAAGGWPEWTIGSAHRVDDPSSFVAHAFRENAPATVADWTHETRFRMPDAFLDLGIRSSLAVPIAGTNGGFGLLGADTRAFRTFGEEDVSFLVSLANIVAAAVARVEGVEALRRSEDEFRATFEQAPIGIAHVELDGRWRRVNRRLCRILDYTTEEILARPYADLVHPDDRAADRAVGDTLGDGADHSVQEKRFVANGRRDVWTRVTTTVKRREDNSPEYVIGIVEDISEQREAQAQISHLQRMEAVGRLTAGIAHDFNNLLTLVIGNLELLEAQCAPGEPAAALVAGALDGATRGAHLTSRLLALARRQPLHPQVVDIGELVGGMAGLLQRTVGREIEVVLRPPPQRCLATVDAAQLESGLMNLAVNARDAMPDGGSLVVSVDAHTFSEGDARQFDGLEAGDYVSITVSDTGTGISAEIVQRIFEPYYTTKEMGKGTGLGLSIVYGFVKQSGGHIVVYSEVGRGTTFRLYLPRHRAAGEGVTDVARYPILPAAGSDERILLVDDRAELRQGLAGRLRDLGYDVAEAESADEALERLERGERVDLVIADVVMSGGLDGADLTRRILQKRETLPTIICSGLDANSLPEAVRMSRRCAVLSKPYAFAEMAGTIRRLLDCREA